LIFSECSNLLDHPLLFVCFPFSLPLKEGRLGGTNSSSISLSNSFHFFSSNCLFLLFDGLMTMTTTSKKYFLPNLCCRVYSFVSLLFLGSRSFKGHSRRPPSLLLPSPISAPYLGTNAHAHLPKIVTSMDTMYSHNIGNFSEPYGVLPSDTPPPHEPLLFLVKERKRDMKKGVFGKSSGRVSISSYANGIYTDTRTHIYTCTCG
jgi:hypothetical protein